MSRIKTRAGGAFSPLVLIVVVVVGITSFAGLGLLSAYAPELKSGNDGGPHALSRSAIGYAGLPKLLRATHAPVILSRGPLGENAFDSLLVLTPSAGTRPTQIADIHHDGPMLIVLPKWRTVPHPEHAGWVSTIGPVSPDEALSMLPVEMRRGTTLTETAGPIDLALRRPNGAAFGATVRIESARRISGAQWIPVLIDASGVPVLVINRHRRVYVLADPDLLNTQSLRTLSGARTAMAVLDIVRPPGAPVAFDLTLHGFQRTRNLGRLMLDPPLVGMTLVLIALAGFAGLQALARFGPARPPARAVALGKRALADNTAGLVRMARREHHMATPYAAMISASVARAIGAPRDLDDQQLDAFLDRVGTNLGATQTYSALAKAARAARSPGDLMQVARDLYRWKQELTRARQ